MRFRRSLAPLALLLSATSFTTPALAAPAMAASRYLTGSDLFNLEVATDPQISPDGRTIAYVRKANDIMTDKARATIWLVDVASGQQRPLVAGAGSYSSPRWSPDGSRLAYVGADSVSPQLFVRWMSSGESARITGLPDSPDSIAWSPDGRRIAYSMFVPDDGPKLGQAPAKPEGAKWADPLQVIDAVTYRFDGAGYFKPGYRAHLLGARRRRRADPADVRRSQCRSAVSWTPDSRSVVFSANIGKNWERDPSEAEIYRVGIEGGTPVALTSRKGPDTSPVVSPSGRQIAYVGYDEDGRAYVDTETLCDEPGRLRRAGREQNRSACVEPGLECDGRSVYVLYDEHGSNRVARVGLDGSMRDVATGLTGSGLDRPYSGGEFSVSRGGAIAVTPGDPTRPSDIAIASGGSVHRLTHLNESALGAKMLGNVSKLPVLSSVISGRSTPGWSRRPTSIRAGNIR